MTKARHDHDFCDAYGIPVPADITERVAWQQRLVSKISRGGARIVRLSAAMAAPRIAFLLAERRPRLTRDREGQLAG